MSHLEQWHGAQDRNLTFRKTLGFFNMGPYFLSFCVKILTGDEIGSVLIKNVKTDNCKKAIQWKRMAKACTSE